MRAIKSINIVVGMLGCFPMLALGAQPATRPAVQVVALESVGTSQSSDPDKSGSSGSSASSDDGKPHRTESSTPSRRGAAHQAPTKEEIADTLNFMKDNSPNRYAAIERLDGDAKAKATDFAVKYYLNVASLDPDLKNVTVQRVRVEDDIYGLVMQMPKDAPDAQQADKDALREQVGKLVELGITERRIRLQRLQETVDREQKKLAADTANPSALVEERLKTILKEENNPVPPSPSPRARNGGSHQPTDNH